MPVAFGVIVLALREPRRCYRHHEDGDSEHHGIGPLPGAREQHRVRGVVLHPPDKIRIVGCSVAGPVVLEDVHRHERGVGLAELLLGEGLLPLGLLLLDLEIVGPAVGVAADPRIPLFHLEGAVPKLCVPLVGAVVDPCRSVAAGVARPHLLVTRRGGKERVANHITHAVGSSLGVEGARPSLVHLVLVCE